VKRGLLIHHSDTETQRLRRDAFVCCGSGSRAINFSALSQRLRVAVVRLSTLGLVLLLAIFSFALVLAGYAAASPPAAVRDDAIVGEWIDVSVPITRAHMRIACATPTDCWIANARAVFPTDPISTSFRPMLHWNGSAWAEAPGSPLASAIDFLAPDDGWAVYAECESYLWRWCHSSVYHWNGASWALMATTPDTNTALIAVEAVAPDDVWFVGGQMVFHTGTPGHLIGYAAAYRWDGQALNYVRPPQAATCIVRDVRRAPDGRLWMGCADNAGIVAGILSYDGAAWTWQDFGAQARPLRLDFVSAQEGWAASTLAFLHYISSTWQSEPIVSNEVYALDMLDATSGFAGGDAGGLYAYDSGAWSGMSSPISNTLVDLLMVSPVDGWALSMDRYPPDGQDHVLRYVRPDITPRVYVPLAVR
jgi:hypothetical protein